MPKLPPKIMNKEIKKYQGRIYILVVKNDDCGNIISSKIEPCPWVESTADYNHYQFQMHHVIKYGSYEKNRLWYAERGLKMCLILLPKLLHEHLEHSDMTDEEFYSIYKIHRHELLFDKKNFNRQGSQFPQMLLVKSEIPTEADFDELLEGL